MPLQVTEPAPHFFEDVNKYQLVSGGNRAQVDTHATGIVKKGSDTITDVNSEWAKLLVPGMLTTDLKYFTQGSYILSVTGTDNPGNGATITMSSPAIEGRAGPEHGIVVVHVCRLSIHLVYGKHHRQHDHRPRSERGDLPAPGHAGHRSRHQTTPRSLTFPRITRPSRWTWLRRGREDRGVRLHGVPSSTWSALWSTTGTPGPTTTLKMPVRRPDESGQDPRSMEPAQAGPRCSDLEIDPSCRQLKVGQVVRARITNSPRTEQNTTIAEILETAHRFG